MPRLSTRSIFLSFLFLLFSLTCVFAAEEITITTYYPSPYGSYNQLQTRTLGVGDNNGNNVLDSGDVPNPITNPGDVWIKGKVGIGTTGPGAKLSFQDVNNGANTDDGITWYNPSPTSYGIYRSAGSWSAPNYQQLMLAWSTGIVIDGGSSYGRSGTVLQPNGGNVGIGTTGPVDILHIDKASNPRIRFTDNETGRTASDGFQIGLTDGVGSFIWNYENTPLRFATNNAEKVRIDSIGNVGIGTTSPGAKLSIWSPTGVNTQLRIQQEGRQYWDFKTGNNQALTLQPQYSTRNEIPWFVINNASTGRSILQVKTEAGAFATQDVPAVNIGTTSDPTNNIQINGSGSSANWASRIFFTKSNNFWQVGMVGSNWGGRDAMGTDYGNTFLIQHFDSTVTPNYMDFNFFPTGILSVPSLIVRGSNTIACPPVQITGNVIIDGNLYVTRDLSVGWRGHKYFVIDHPTKPNMELVHACIEGPESAVYYRGEGKLTGGKAIIKLPEYFEALTRKDGRTVQLTAKGKEPFLLSYTDIIKGEFTAYGTKPDGEFSWEVKVVRADVAPFEVERPKAAVPKEADKKAVSRKL